ncbi:YtxH domain-containing protein [Agreia sp. PsM10]|uniref:YtxH domain-containing protein n=1 Tax=Agreia sp. PsM10 TaxID=3030533 RepID=UPI00263B4E77|nr:YtxH domain-containing protein [Agreia sp. PsM10]MDN4639798.1 YtxH domain-containing protein [Agreia sp. PsM10]
MRGKLILVVGLATGYVLGSRAGRPRYEQIKAGADKVWNLAPVQQVAGAVREFAGQRVDTVQLKAGNATKKAVRSLLHLDDTPAKSAGPAKKKSTSGAKSSAGTSSSTKMTPATPAPATAATDTDE